MKKIHFVENSPIYSPQDIRQVLDLSVNDKNLIGNSKGVKFYNIPCSFDIETTSFYRDEEGRTYTYERSLKKVDDQGRRAKLEKVAIMYVWQFGINGRVIMGRTWEEFVTMCNIISEVLQLSTDRRLLCYIHNLSFEFQFMRTQFDWVKVFSIDQRKPIYAITSGFIEFRCSYLLSGYGLSNLSKQLLKYPCYKMVGDLDYNLIRHSKTPLTPQEVGYCVNDIRVVMAYIQEKIEENKGINRLPLTKTGFVRQYCRKQCLRSNKDGKTVPNWDYINLMRGLQINDLTELDMLQRAFAGGFTHANANYADEVINEVDSYDFTSSYPYVMVAEQFPMSKGVLVNVKSMAQFEFLISKYCCVFDIEFTNIYASVTHENPISVSKCYIKQNVAENNGRLVVAEKICITITEIDYNIIKNFYTWDKVRIGKMYCYKRDYLPTEFVHSILKLYEKKTKLKGVEGKEAEYLNSKEMLNSCYGMCVTNPLRDEFTYNGVWDVEQITPEMRKEQLFKYNTSKNRFLYYIWGIYVTAYARRNLFTGIYATGEDYIYSDTDSLKIKNGDKYKQYFDTFNWQVVEKLRKACIHHNLPFSLCEPETVKGITKTLGVWDYEGRYKRFKTLGAKRYMVQEKNALHVGNKAYDYSLTVSGVNKKTAIPYLLEKYGEQGIFEAFTNYLEIPPIALGKNIHTYVDYEISGQITDYTGVKADFAERSGLHLEPTGYSLSLSVMYINYLRGIKFKD